MKPEDTQHTEPAQDIQSDVPQDAAVVIDKPHKPARRKTLFIILGVGVLVIILALASATWFMRDKSVGNAVFQKLTGRQLLYGHVIPQTNCTDLEQFAEDKDLFQDSQNNYQCFKGTFKVDSEKITYASIRLTKEFDDESRSKCQLDCGFSPGDTPEEQINVGDFILRENGSIEYYSGAGGGSVDSMLNELTGCGKGSTFVDNDELQKGTLVIDNNKLGLQTRLSDLHSTDSFGNECTADLELVSYLSSSEEGWEVTSAVSVKSIAVHYQLKEVSSCNATTTPSARYECFTTQAALRSNAALCDNLKNISLDSEREPEFDYCIIAVAKRKKDPAVCNQIRDYREEFVESCQRDVKKLKVAFSKDITQR